MKLFKKKSKEAVTDPNPMLKVEHPHNWLPANDGLELVCGDCGLRQWTEKGKENGKSKKS